MMEPKVLCKLGISGAVQGLMDEAVRCVRGCAGSSLQSPGVFRLSFRLPEC